MSGPDFIPALKAENDKRHAKHVAWNDRCETCGRPTSWPKCSCGERKLREAVVQAHSMLSGICWEKVEDHNGQPFPQKRLQEVYALLHAAKHAGEAT